MRSSGSTLRFLPVRAIAAATLTLVCASSWALPAYTFNPAGASPALDGGAVTSDNFIVSSRAHVTIDAGTGNFTNTGLLSVQSFQNEGAVVESPGLNSTYGLYIAYSATGTSTLGNMLLDFTHGSLTSFNYTLYGFNGPAATFGFDASNNPTTTASGAFALATGTLLQGSTSTSPALNEGVDSFVPSTNATLTFTPVATQLGFFAAPVPFNNLAYGSFTNTVSQVESINAFEYRIRQGGGAINFGVSAVPEPESYAMMMAGLGVFGFIARQRNARKLRVA